MNFIVLDTETTNSFDDPLVYDCGWSVINEQNETLLTRSFVNADIFIDEPNLMKSAYFAEKIPMYFEDIADNKRTLAHWNTIRKTLKKDCDNYNVVAIVAHNAKFDYKACQTTQRFLTKSKYRWFFPYGVYIWDSLKMAQQTFAKDENYRAFCKENDYIIKGRPRLTAEILYRYITGNNDFIESHTGLEDTQIEKDIFLACLAMDKNVNCNCWKDKAEEVTEMSPLFISFFGRGVFARKNAKFSIIPPPAHFVKQKFKKNCTKINPKICAILLIDFYKNFCYNLYIR